MSEAYWKAFVESLDEAQFEALRKAVTVRVHKWDYNPSVDELSLWNKGHKISAVQQYRARGLTATGVKPGIKEAKDLFESSGKNSVGSKPPPFVSTMPEPSLSEKKDWHGGNPIAAIKSYRGRVVDPFSNVCIYTLKEIKDMFEGRFGSAPISNPPCSA